MNGSDGFFGWRRIASSCCPSSATRTLDDSERGVPGVWLIRKLVVERLLDFIFSVEAVRGKESSSEKMECRVYVCVVCSVRCSPKDA